MWQFMAITFSFLGWAFYVLSGGSDYAPGGNSLQANAGSASAATVEVSALASTQPEVSRSASSLAALESSQGERVDITLASIEAGEVTRVTPGVIGQSGEREQPGYKSWSAESGYSDDAEQVGYKRIEIAVSQEDIDAAVAEANAAEQPESVKTGFIGEDVFSLETYVMRKTGQIATPEPVAEAEARPVAASGDIRSVTGDVVNMRSGPGTDFERVGSVTKGTQIAVLEEPGNGWIMLEVVDTGEVAWMADWLVTASN